jgi:hypothetical protein
LLKGGFMRLLLPLNYFRSIALVIAAAGCGDEPVPTCAQAVPHFYGVGCTFSGTVAPTNIDWDMAGAINACQQIEAQAPKACGSEFDDWMTCVGDASGNQCDSCTDEYDRLVITTDGSPILNYLFGCD